MVFVLNIFCTLLCIVHKMYTTLLCKHQTLLSMMGVYTILHCLFEGVYIDIVLYWLGYHYIPSQWL